MIYTFRFGTTNGIGRKESGQFEKKGDDNIWVVTGVYTYIDETGRIYAVNYTADENGYRANIKWENAPPVTMFVDFVSASAIATLTGGIG